MKRVDEHRSTRLSRRRLVALVGIGALLAELAVVQVSSLVTGHHIGQDFLGTIYRPAVALVHGHSPYGDPRVPGPLASSVYPPSAFVPLVWFGLLPRGIAVGLWLVTLAGVAISTLVVLGQRDPRVFVLWLLTPLILLTTSYGNATVLVVFLVALLWRFRDQPVAAAAALTIAIAIKLFVAPLVVWLVVKRRFRAALYTAVATPVVVLLAWATIGFSDIGRFPSILSANDSIFSANGPFIQALVLQAGGTSAMALTLGALVGAALLFASHRVGDVGAFTLAITASILLAPVAWIGYLGLLVVPVAVMWARLSWAWLLLTVGTYADLTYSPLQFASARLSVFTISQLALVVILVLSRERRLEGRGQALLVGAPA